LIEIKELTPKNCRHYVSIRVKFLAFARVRVDKPVESCRAFGSYRAYFYGEIMIISDALSSKAFALDVETVKQTLCRRNRAERLSGGEHVAD
jgi:hypothetical protein